MKHYIEAVLKARKRRKELGLKVYQANTAFHPVDGFKKLPIIEAQDFDQAVEQVCSVYGRNCVIKSGTNNFGEDWVALDYSRFSVLIKEVR